MANKRNFRNATFEVRAEGEGETAKSRVYLSFSSEAPCPMMVTDESGHEILAAEVLGHNSEEIDRSRMVDGLVVQDNHDGDQIGLIREVELIDGKLGGFVDFCHGTRAKEIEADALAGLRRNMSVGYFVKKWQRVQGESFDGLPVFRAVDWCPFEASFVNVPADVQVGVGRAIADEATPAAPAAESESVMDEIKKPEEAAGAAPCKAIDNEEIKAIVKEAVAEALAKPEEEKPEMPAPETKKAVFAIGGAADNKREYDIMKAIRSLAGDRKVDAGFEREVSDEIGRQTHRDAQGFFIPETVLAGRAFDKTTYGGNLVATDTLFNEMVPALVAETVLGKAGVRTITGLKGDVEIPVADKATGYWVSSEGGDATETTPTIGQLQASPKTVGAFTEITRKLMNQSGIGVQAFISDALRSALARAIETAAFSGSGTSGQPSGLDGNANINTVASATNPGLAKVLEFITAIEDANANGPNMKFLGRPSVWALLGSTFDYKELTSSDTVVGGVSSGKYLLDTANNTCQGYEFIKSNLCTAKKLYFGDWSKIILAFWSGLDLTVDTSSLSKSGGVRLVALQDMDVVVSQPKAFAVGQVIA